MTPVLFKNFFPDGVKATITDRSGDFILPEKATGLSIEQTKYLSDHFAISADQVFTIRQVHDNKILVLAKKDVPQKGPIPIADGVITNIPGLVLSVRTADCLPIFIYDPQRKAIGLVHAGWRGSSEKIIVAAIKAMENTYGSHSPDLLVALGPAIRVCCYKVGEEFRDVFPKEVSPHKQKGTYHLDLALVNKHQLMEYGIKGTNIFDSQQCTMCDNKFFSYRREKEKAGRHLSLLMLI